MADSDAERQRRYRRHKAGDHTLCRSETCDQAPPDGHVTVVTRHGRTSRRETRGERLWRELTAAGEPSPARRVLMEEACRIVDRLDKLDRLLDGDAEDWLSLVEDKGDPERQIVVIDRPLAEARQQATALKQLVAELRQGQVDQPEQGGGILDQLAARRAARRAGAAGRELPAAP